MLSNYWIIIRLTKDGKYANTRATKGIAGLCGQWNVRAGRGNPVAEPQKNIRRKKKTGTKRTGI